MNIDNLLEAVQRRILADEVLDDLLDSVRVVRGPRRPEGWAGEDCFTVFLLSAPIDPDFQTVNGTLRVNHYCPLFPSGNANTEFMGEVMERLVDILNEKVEVKGMDVIDWYVNEPLGPLYEGNAPGEAFSSVSINFFIK